MGRYSTIFWDRASLIVNCFYALCDSHLPYGYLPVFAVSSISIIVAIALRAKVTASPRSRVPSHSVSYRSFFLFSTRRGAAHQPHTSPGPRNTGRLSVQAVPQASPNSICALQAAQIVLLPLSLSLSPSLFRHYHLLIVQPWYGSPFYSMSHNPDSMS